jgi:2-polyprenyl-6-methoxyphenol hydroxylase-like FAD-dependent oxidoreductase
MSLIMRPGVRLDVLVVGAGPTGLTLAAQLRALGARTRIVDRQRDRVHESRALAIQPRTLEVLGGLGVARTLVERGNPAVRLRLHAGERSTPPLRLFDVGVDDTAYPFVLFLSQAETEAVLRQHLAAGGVAVERGVELAGFEGSQDDQELVCTLRHDDGVTEQVRARYLVGCDGAHSSVRHLAGIPFQGGPYPRTFALADLEVDGGLEPGSVHVFTGRPGMLFFFPLGRPATWRLIGMRPTTSSPGDGERDPVAPSLGDLQAVVDAFAGGRLRLRDPAWLTYFRLHHRQAARYRAGRAFLAGDAAHVHSPAGGQGMNTGIQDACNLAWKLALTARGLADPALLDSYQAERWPVGRQVLRFTDRPFAVATSTNPLVSLLRTWAPRMAPLVLRLPTLRARGFRAIAQLDVGYRHSPIVQEGTPGLRRGPHAGDRLPDAQVTRDGQVCWLGDALGAPGFHLLLCGLTGAWDAARLDALRERYASLVAVHHLARHAASGALHDPDGAALTRLGVTQAAQYLVRPDGHIAFRSGGTDLDGVTGYLARWLPGTEPRPG